MRLYQIIRIALAAVLLAGLPCAAAPITVTVSGQWFETGTTPVNRGTEFTLSFETEQTVSPFYSDPGAFMAGPVTMQYTSGGTTTNHMGLIAYYELGPTRHGFDFRLFDWEAPGQSLQILADLPGYGFSGTTDSPTLLEVTAVGTSAVAYFIPGHEMSSTYLAIADLRVNYSAMLGGGDNGNGNGNGQDPSPIPEPGSMALLAAGLAGLAVASRRRR